MVKLKTKTYIFVLVVVLLIIGIFIIINIDKSKPNFLKLDLSLGNNIYTSNLDYFNTYNTSTQNIIENEIYSLMSKKNSFENPLIIYNPYGTNKLALNIYFYDKENLKFSYEISTNNSTFSQNVYINSKSDFYEFQIIGVESGENNKITILSSDNRTYTFEINIPQYNVPKTIITNSNKDDIKLSDGFYAYLGMLNGNDVDDVYLVDNNGIVRGIITLKGNNYDEENSTADNIIFYNNYMFYNISSNQIAKVNNLGKVEDIYSFDGYNKHHDFVIDKENDKLLVLASKDDSSTMEDIILIYDLTSKKSYNIIDLKSILLEIYSKVDKNYTNFYSKGKIDWIHINSIDIKDNQLIISSRELSSIICLSDVYTTPKLYYILGDKTMYENTSYYNVVYSQKNDFFMHLGQHTAYFYNNNEYIALYNNNYGISPIIDWFDWNKHINNKMEKSSFFYLYKINNNDKTYELVDKIEVPYSALMSSAQILKNNNKVISSRGCRIFAEYDNNNNLIAKFETDRYIYRVNKYDFKEFWFE